MKLNVTDMMCEHCKAKITKGLDKADIACQIDLENKTVEVDDKDEKEAREIIRKLGYTVK